jgi:hypothetical protein
MAQIASIVFWAEPLFLGDGDVENSLGAREQLDISPNMCCVREWYRKVGYFCCSDNTEYYHTLRIAQWLGAS